MWPSIQPVLDPLPLRLIRRPTLMRPDQTQFLLEGIGLGRSVFAQPVKLLGRGSQRLAVAAFCCWGEDADEGLSCSSLPLKSRRGCSALVTDETPRDVLNLHCYLTSIGTDAPMSIGLVRWWKCDT
jgi:hypothetical protein